MHLRIVQTSDVLYAWFRFTPRSFRKASDTGVPQVPATTGGISATLSHHYTMTFASPLSLPSTREGSEVEP